MFCGNCGAENTDGAKFCKECGNPLTSGSTGKSEAGGNVGAIKKEKFISDNANVSIKKVAGLPKTIQISADVSMMDIMKRKTTLIALLSLVLAIVCTVISSVSVPSNKLVTKMGKAIQEKNVQKFVSCFSPDDQADAELDFDFYYTEEVYDDIGSLFEESEYDSKEYKRSAYKRILLQGEEIKGDDNTITIPVKLIVISDGEIVDDSSFEVTQYEQDGVKYLK